MNLDSAVAKYMKGSHTDCTAPTVSGSDYDSDATEEQPEDEPRPNAKPPPGFRRHRTARVGRTISTLTFGALLVSSASGFAIPQRLDPTTTMTSILVGASFVNGDDSRPPGGPLLSHGMYEWTNPFPAGFRWLARKAGWSDSSQEEATGKDNMTRPTNDTKTNETHESSSTWWKGFGAQWTLSISSTRKWSVVLATRPGACAHCAFLRLRGRASPACRPRPSPRRDFCASWSLFK
jgi:hypothetical protein